MFRDPSIGIGGKDGSRLVTMEDYMFNDRKLWLQGRITPDTVDSLLSQLIIIEENYTFLGIINQTDVDVTIYISSPGGSLTSLNLYDYLLHTPLKIRTVVTGYAYSAAALVFLAGSERCLMPYSRVMFHEPCFSGSNISDESIEGIDYICGDLKNHKDTTLNIISERTGLSKKMVRGKITNRKWFLNADETVKLGIADKIVHSL